MDKKENDNTEKLVLGSVLRREVMRTYNRSFIEFTRPVAERKPNNEVLVSWIGYCTMPKDEWKKILERSKVDIDK